jgi:TRAP-type C4-dicarboxylate transport system permease small subunit
MSELKTVELPPRERTLLDRLCEVFALAGGAVLTALALMSVWSIVGRWFVSKPLQGDYELVQTGCAIFVALCLPYCQLKYGNIIIDFFTAKASLRTQAQLDAIGALLLGLVMLLVAWRTGAGLTSIRASGETTTILGMPTWWTYAGMLPGIALTAIVAFRCALDRFRASRR